MGRAEDFSYDLDRMECVCPAGNELYQAGKDMPFNGYRAARFKAPITACRNCPLRAKCLRKPDRTPHRQLTIIKHTEGPPQQAKPNPSTVGRTVDVFSHVKTAI